MSSPTRPRGARPSPGLYSIKALAPLFTLVMASLVLLALTPHARAQSGPSGSWSVTDANNNQLSMVQNPDGSYGYPLTGLISASAADTYPADLPPSLMGCFGPNPYYGGTFTTAPTPRPSAASGARPGTTTTAPAPTTTAACSSP